MKFSKMKEKIKLVLIWSEKYTKTDMLYIAKEGIWLGGTHVIRILLLFGLSLAYANLLSPTDYGMLRYILSTFAILSFLSFPGIDIALIQKVSEKKIPFSNKFVHTRILYSFLGSIAFITLAGWYFFHTDYTFAFFSIIIALFFPFYHSLDVYKSYLQGIQQFKILGICETWETLGTTLSVIATLFFTKNILIILCIYLGTWTLLKVILYTYTYRKFLKASLPTASDIQGVFSYGKSLTLVNVIQIISFHLDKILIFQFLGAAELAIYTFAIALPEQIKGLLKYINALALPKFSQKKMPSTHHEIIQKMFRATLLIFPIVCLYIFLAPIIFRLFFPQYESSILFTQIFSTTLLTFPFYLTGTILQAQKKAKQFTSYIISVHTLNIIIIFTGVYFFGLYGAIIGAVLNKYVGALISLAYLKSSG